MPNPWGRAIEALRLQRQTAPGARKRDWTQAAVARRAKMTATTYGKIEKGAHTLTSQLRDIADVFGVPIEAVLVPAAPVLMGDVRQQQKELFDEWMRERFAPQTPIQADDTLAAAIQATRRDADRRKAEAEALAETARKSKRRKPPGNK